MERGTREVGGKYSPGGKEKTRRREGWGKAQQGGHKHTNGSRLSMYAFGTI